MWTRKQYLAQECTFDEYYLPIAQECGISLVKNPIAWYCLRDTDPYFNQLTTLEQWDNIAAWNQACFKRALEKRGDQYSLGSCILKSIARHEKAQGLYECWQDKPCPSLRVAERLR